MGKHFGLWQGATYNLAMKFATCGEVMVKNGTSEDGTVTINFLASSVTPAFHIDRHRSHIKHCRDFLGEMESHYRNTLLMALMRVEQDAGGQVHYHVELETLDPAVSVLGTLVHVKGMTYRWESSPKLARHQRA